MKMTWNILLLCLFLIHGVASERIVIFHGISSYSHRVPTWPLAVDLTERGHEVSYIAPFYPNEPHPNITELVPQKMVDFVNDFAGEEYDINLRVDKSMDTLFGTVFDMAHGTCEALLSSPEFKNWLKENQNKTFDLFIVDNCLPECGFGIANYVGAKKVIIFNTIVPFPHEYDVTGFLPQHSAIPEVEIDSPKTPLGFFDRLYNTYISLRWRLRHYFYAMKIDAVIRAGLNHPKMPYIEDLLRNVSLIFYTGDVVTDYPRSLPPLFVNVAGTHCKDSTKPLPKELEVFINETLPGKKNDGFVYISLGSLLISSNLPDNIKQIFFDVVKSFPNIKFFWKWNGDFPKEIPENLFLSKWFPQMDILSHPKILAFVTQNGRPSTLEALYFGVPMISFPISADQNMNANRLEELGGTIPFEIGTVTFKEFRDAVEKVVYDPSVKKRMTQLQQIFRDRPAPPVETARWWIDYVLRHEDTSHLRAAGYDQYWFVRRQVDVWAFLSISAFVILIGILAATIKVLNFVIANKKSSVKLKKS